MSAAMGRARARLRALAGSTVLHWASWASAAFGSGIESIKDCVPSCVSNGTFYTFSVLVVLRRPEPWPQHRGTLYFTRLTEIYTGNRPAARCPASLWMGMTASL